MAKHHTKPKGMSANERLKSRYVNARRELRSYRTTKEQQKEIMFLIQRIEAYGFDFFPDHYIRHHVVELENKIERLKAAA